MRLRSSHALLMFAWLGACGGQTALDLDPAEAFHADAAGGTRGAGAVGAGGTGGKAGTGAVGAGGRLGTGGATDAGKDVLPDRFVADAAVRDAPNDDACAPLDPKEPCGCPAGDWFVEVRIPQGSTRLTAAHVLKLHCTEDAPVVANNGCNDVLRLSACAGPANQPTCFYLAASPTRGFFVGFLKIDAQNSFGLTGGSIELSRDEPPVREGVFKATAQVGSESVALEGNFRACAAPYGR